MRAYLLVLFTILITAETYAQSFYNSRRGRDVIVSVGTGVSSYFGDLNDPGDIIDTDLHVNLGAQYFFTKRIAGRAELSWFKLSGDDAKSDSEGRVRRNLSFTSSNFEFNAVGIVNAFEYGPRFYQRPQFNAYGFAGLGVIYFNPKGELDGEKYALQPLQTEGVDYSRVAPVLIYGGGVKYMINPFTNIVLEAGYRQTFTDYLDDVSTEYIANSSFEDPIAARLADRRPEIGLPVQEPG
ncbi:hypothetical protein E1176_12885, partial [Fulvivirga sp. RKSG066]|uniref:DUF6089 family protein n=1 Tax=Fulvivirga aurantia TaxID=2529383 RepID=UPI0012BC02C6